MKRAKMILTVALVAAMAAFGEDYDPEKHGNPIRVLDGTVEIDGKGVTIDAKGQARCATLGPNVTLKNFTFRRGKAEIGGGVYGGRLVNCTVTGCSASESGAALANCTAVDCTIAGNAFANGMSIVAAHGGILFGSSLTNCTVRDNRSVFGSEAPAFGGVGERVTLVGCTVTNNTVVAGSGVCYGTLFAQATVDGVEVEFLDGERKDAGGDDPQPDPSTYLPEIDPILTVGEGIINRYYDPVDLYRLGDGLSSSYGRKVTVKVEGLPKGLKLMKELNLRDEYEYWIEGVPTEELDGESRIAYVRITDAQKNVTFKPLANLRILPATEACFAPGTVGSEYWKFPVSEVFTDYSAGDTGWTFSGWPTGIKFASKAATYNGATVEAGRIYGLPTKAGYYTVKAVKKIAGTSYSDTHYATFEIRYRDGEDPQDPSTPAPAFDIDLGGLSEVEPSVTGIRVGVAYDLAITNTAGSTVAQSGLPTGLKLKSAKSQRTGATSYSVTGVPTKAGYFLVTFTTKLDGVSTVRTVAFKAEALPDWAVGTFNGFATNADDRASATMTATAVGKVSGKIVLGGKTWSFSQTGYSAEVATGEGTAFAVAATAKNGKSEREIVLSVGEDGAFGEMEDDFEIALWRNVWKETSVPEAYVGSSAAWLVAPEGAEYGDGTLSLTVDRKGNCKAGGKLPDGTSVSGKLPLILTDDGLFAIWYQSPSAYKGGCVFGLLGLDGEGGVFGLTDVDWISFGKTAFRRTLTAGGSNAAGK